MVMRIEDLNLPTAVVNRLIKQALPDSANISKEARAAITRAASVFVIFLTSTSTTVAHKQNHKTMTANNVLESLKKMEFDEFIPQLEQDLEVYRKMLKDKKDTKAKASAAATTATNAEDGEDDTEKQDEASVN